MIELEDAEVSYFNTLSTKQRERHRVLNRDNRDVDIALAKIRTATPKPLHEPGSGSFVYFAWRLAEMGISGNHGRTAAREVVSATVLAVADINFSL